VATTEPVPLFRRTRAKIGAKMKLLCLVVVALTTAESEELTHVTLPAATGFVGLFGSSNVD